MSRLQCELHGYINDRVELLRSCPYCIIDELMQRLEKQAKYHFYMMEHNHQDIEHLIEENSELKIKLAKAMEWGSLSGSTDR
jgi:hypothetical protein